MSKQIAGTRGRAVPCLETRQKPSDDTAFLDVCWNDARSLGWLRKYAAVEVKITGMGLTTSWDETIRHGKREALVAEGQDLLERYLEWVEKEE